jgi:hypothetical protein
VVAIDNIYFKSYSIPSLQTRLIDVLGA